MKNLSKESLHFNFEGELLGYTANEIEDMCRAMAYADHQLKIWSGEQLTPAQSRGSPHEIQTREWQLQLILDCMASQEQTTNYHAIATWDAVT
eukprot:816921-Pelagomonas_calceolata.AAC.1